MAGGLPANFYGEFLTVLVRDFDEYVVSLLDACAVVDEDLCVFNYSWIQSSELLISTQFTVDIVFARKSGDPVFTRMVLPRSPSFCVCGTNGAGN